MGSRTIASLPSKTVWIHHELGGGFWCLTRGGQEGQTYMPFRRALRAAARALLTSDAELRLSAPMSLLSRPDILNVIQLYNMDRSLAEDLYAQGVLGAALDKLRRKGRKV
jgi:hypothetical protein